MQFRRSLTTSTLVLTFVYATTPTITAAQWPTSNPVDAYVRQALPANLSLAQTQLDGDRAD